MTQHKEQIELTLIHPRDEFELSLIIDQFNKEQLYQRFGQWFVIDEISAPFDHQPNDWKVTVKLSEVSNDNNHTS